MVLKRNVKHSCTRCYGGWYFRFRDHRICRQTDRMQYSGFQSKGKMLSYGCRTGVLFFDKNRVRRFFRKDIVNENFVYLDLRRRITHPSEIALETPAFATLGNGEIDFFVKVTFRGNVCSRGKKRKEQRKDGSKSSGEEKSRLHSQFRYTGLQNTNFSNTDLDNHSGRF